MNDNPDRQIELLTFDLSQADRQIELLTFDLSQAEGQIIALRRQVDTLLAERAKLEHDCNELPLLIRNFQQSLQRLLEVNDD